MFTRYLTQLPNPKKRNPVVAHCIVSLKILLFAIQYKGSKGAWVNYSTGEVYPIE